MKPPHKKRHRVPASCSVCRRRKSKCDRAKPICGSCKQKSISHLCFYESDYRDSNDEPRSDDVQYRSGERPLQTAGEPMATIQVIPSPLAGGSFANGAIPPATGGSHFVDYAEQSPLAFSFQPTNSPIHNNVYSNEPSVGYIPQSYDGTNSNGNTLQHSATSVNKAFNQPPLPHNINLPPLNDNISVNTNAPQPKPKDQNLIAVSIGPHSTLQINSSDTIDILNSASYSYDVDGRLWQHQGPLSYIGVIKSDPFIKILRHYALKLFQSGDIAQYILAETSKRRDLALSSPREINVTGETNSVISTSEQDNLMNSIENETHDIKHDNNENDNEKILDLQKSRRQSTSQWSPSSQKEPGSNNDKVSRNIKKESASLDEDNMKFFPRLKSLVLKAKDKTELFSIAESMILKFLPSKKNTFIIFYKFFKYVYPFVPIIDENSFIMDLNEVFPEKFPFFENDYYSEIRVTDDEDLTLLGILMLVMRLGYMSLINHEVSNNEYNEDEISIILEMKKISTDTFNSILNICIPDCLTSRSSFRTVQCLFLLHFYKRVAPNDSHGLGGVDADILFGAIVKHALSIGLNRDPTFYSRHDSILKKPALVKTWRLLWQLIVITDAESAIQSGTNLNIRTLEFVDVKNPEIDNLSGEVEDTFSYIKQICDSYRRIVNMISDIQNKPKVLDILIETKNLEQIFFKFFGKDYFKDHICKPAPTVDNHASHIHVKSEQHGQSYLKVIKYLTFITLRTNLSCLYYKIAAHYEDEHTKSNTVSMNAGIELFKIHIKSVVQLVYIISHVLDHSDELFGSNYDYILTAVNERCMIRTHSFLTSLFARLLHYKQTLNEAKTKDTNFNERSRAVDELFNRIIIESEIFVGNFRKLSRTYINSYKLYVMTYFVLRQSMDNVDVFFSELKISHTGTNMLEFFTISELEYLCKLCEEVRSAKEERDKLSKKRRGLGGTTTHSAISLPLSVDLTDSSRVSLDGSSMEIGDFNLNSVFGTPFLTNEELLRLFEIYADLDVDT
ncbi:uncharacterized protein PRCAT00006080001 [Priceomyces carsonii]|uniref:uncharacterized protein n=1 Tax=Priceomyces carsonii TaxID=28549 RepID=UPI002ED7A345|nr:unnamed protein product [Priceomyces carsonii]